LAALKTDGPGTFATGAFLGGSFFLPVRLYDLLARRRPLGQPTPDRSDFPCADVGAQPDAFRKPLIVDHPQQLRPISRDSRFDQIGETAVNGQLGIVAGVINTAAAIAVALVKCFFSFFFEEGLAASCDAPKW